MSPLVIERFSEYMHSHRRLPDGSLRASDNWTKGMPLDAYMKSGWRHFLDWWHHHRDTGLAREGLEDALCALLFNVQGYLFEVLKAKQEPKDWGGMLSELGHEFAKNGEIVAKERDSLWTGEDVERAWPPRTPSVDPKLTPDEIEAVLAQGREPLTKFSRCGLPMPDTNYRVVPRFAVEDGFDLDSVLDPDFTSGLSPVEYLDKFHAGELSSGPAAPASLAPQDEATEREARFPSPKRKYSLYDLGTYEMQEADYENRRSMGVWEDPDKARVAIEYMEELGWAKKCQ